MLLAFITLPLIAALIGWLMMRSSIWLISHPVHPVTIGPVTLQGLIYKNEERFKKELARLIKHEMGAVEQISDKLASTANIDKLKPQLNEHIDVFLKVRLKQAMPMIGMLIGDRTIGQLKALFMEELETLFPAVMKTCIGHIKDDIDLDRLITEKVNAFPVQNIEKIIRTQFGRDISKASLMAAFIGLLLGLVQLLIVIILLP